MGQAFTYRGIAEGEAVNVFSGNVTASPLAGISTLYVTYTDTETNVTTVTGDLVISSTSTSDVLYSSRLSASESAPSAVSFGEAVTASRLVLVDSNVLSKLAAQILARALRSVDSALLTVSVIASDGSRMVVDISSATGLSTTNVTALITSLILGEATFVGSSTAYTSSPSVTYIGEVFAPSQSAVTSQYRLLRAFEAAIDSNSLASVLSTVRRLIAVSSILTQSQSLLSESVVTRSGYLIVPSSSSVSCYGTTAGLTVGNVILLPTSSVTTESSIARATSNLNLPVESVVPPTDCVIIRDFSVQINGSALASSVPSKIAISQVDPILAYSGGLLDSSIERVPAIDSLLGESYVLATAGTAGFLLGFANVSTLSSILASSSRLSDGFSQMQAALSCSPQASRAVDCQATAGGSLIASFVPYKTVSREVDLVIDSSAVSDAVRGVLQAVELLSTSYTSINFYAKVDVTLDSGLVISRETLLRNAESLADSISEIDVTVHYTLREGEALSFSPATLAANGSRAVNSIVELLSLSQASCFMPEPRRIARLKIRAKKRAVIVTPRVYTTEN